MRIKPRILVDLQRSESRIYTSRPARVNLSSGTLRIPLIRFCKALTVLAVFSYLSLGSVLAPIDGSQKSFAAQNDQERQQLEQQLQDLESQISQYQATIDQYQTKGKSLQGEINSLNAQIAKLNLQIKSINLTLKKLDGDIITNQNQIATTQNQIDENKTVLTRAIQSIYESDNLSLAEILLSNPSLAAFFSNVNDLMYIQDSLRGTLTKTVDLHNNLLDQKEQLALKKTDVNNLKNYQLAEKDALAVTKQDKNSLLRVTKGQESKYQDLLKQTQKTAAQIRSRIFELLGGGELSFEDAYKFAQFAEQATGVPAAFVLAVLDRESALGQNVGKCSYQTAMNPTREAPLFLALLSQLNINPTTVTVSCPNRDGLYGGAMGPAQFLPSTWNLYSSKIADLTGSNPPSPWRNSDAFMATALYLKDAMNGCSVYSGLAQERCAAARYYAGARWRSYLWTYGDRVVAQAQQFQKDINILNS